MDSPEEKPLIKIAGRPMIEHVLRALKDVKDVGRIFVATSPHTPKTAEEMAKYPIEVVETPGKDYVSDMQFAVRKLKLGATLIVSADLPLLTGRLLEDVINHFHRCKKPALAVMVPQETFQKLGLKPPEGLEVESRRLVPAGVNVIEGGRIDEAEIEQENLILDRPELAVNVNTSSDVKMAEKILQEKLKPSFKSVGGQPFSAKNHQALCAGDS